MWGDMTRKRQPIGDLFRQAVTLVDTSAFKYSPDLQEVKLGTADSFWYDESRKISALAQRSWILPTLFSMR